MKNFIEKRRERGPFESSLPLRKDTNLPPWSAAVFRGKVLSF